MSLLDYAGRQKDQSIDEGLVKWIMIYLLKAVDYLHTSGVVHTGKSFIRTPLHVIKILVEDIKLDNIQHTLPDNEHEILGRLVEDERKQPSPVKKTNTGRFIYASRPIEYGNVMTYPILSDLGMCRLGQERYQGIIQAPPYRAPEVILRGDWDSGVDIWNLGVLVSHLRLIYGISYLLSMKDMGATLRRASVWKLRRT